jgi:hypothetical protein
MAEDTSVGGVTWHSSGEDEGPDVGVSVMLENSVRLYCGEISRDLFERTGASEHFDSDLGWFFVRYRAGDDVQVLGKCADLHEGREFMEEIAALAERAHEAMTKPEVLAAKPTPEPEAPAVELPSGDYAIAECLGHRTLIGRVAEIERFGIKMLQIEPLYKGALLPPVFVGGGSLYAFTPCTKEVALKRCPKSPYEIPASLRATMPDEGVPLLSSNRFEEEDEGMQF